VILQLPGVGDLSQLSVNWETAKKVVKMLRQAEPGAISSP
jgi:hypothetical protein